MKISLLFPLTVFTFITLLSCGQKPSKPIPPLEAKLSMVFVDNADKGEYSAGLSITKGAIHLGDTLYATRQSLTIPFIVREIKVADKTVSSSGPTENAFIVFQAIGDGSKFDYDFTLSNSRPFNSTIAQSSNSPKNNGSYEQRVENCTGESNLNVRLDGGKWSVAMLAEDRLYYEKGLSYMNCKTGYLQLAMHGCSGDDDRQLLISICGFSGKTGVVNTDAATYTFSGSTGTDPNAELNIGEVFGKKKDQMKLEIIKFERISPNSAKISLKFSGIMPASLTYPKVVTFEESVLTDIEVKVFTEAH